MRMKSMKLVAATIVLSVIILAIIPLAEAQYRRYYTVPRNSRGAVKHSEPGRLSNWLAMELNLTPREKSAIMPQIRKIMTLKRKAAPGLKRLKALHSDNKASDEKVAAGLNRFRNNLADARARIVREEKKLVDMKEMTPRRELTLTILGILDNGKSLPDIPKVRNQARRRPA